MLFVTTQLTPFVIEYVFVIGETLVTWFVIE